jgi:hypothetical protein
VFDVAQIDCATHPAPIHQRDRIQHRTPGLTIASSNVVLYSGNGQLLVFVSLARLLPPPLPLLLGGLGKALGLTGSPKAGPGGLLLNAACPRSRWIIFLSGTFIPTFTTSKPTPAPTFRPPVPEEEGGEGVIVGCAVLRLSLRESVRAEAPRTISTFSADAISHSSSFPFFSPLQFRLKRPPRPPPLLLFWRA